MITQLTASSRFLIARLPAIAGLLVISAALAQQQGPDARTRYERAMRIGHELCIAGRFEESFALWDAAQKANPASAEPIAWRCHAFHELGEDDRALPECNRALTRDPRLAIAYRFRGEISFELDENAAALADLSRAVSLDPNDFEAWALRAFTFRKMRRREEALADINRALAIAPGQPDLLIVRSMIYREGSEFDQAEADLRQALDIEPRSRRAWEQYVMLRRAMQDEAGARKAEQILEQMRQGR